MPVHLAARMHAFVNGLLRPSDEQETRELYERVAGQFRAHGVATPAGRRVLIADLTAEVLAGFDIPPDHPQAEAVARFVSRLLDYERLFLLPNVDWTERRSISEYWAIREELQRQRAVIQAFPETRNLLHDAITAILDSLYRACPALTQAPDRRKRLLEPERVPGKRIFGAA